MVPLAGFLIAFGLFPFLTRVLFLKPKSSSSKRTLTGLLQDIFILLELYLLACLLPFVFLPIAVLVQSYILLDGYLYHRIKDRLGVGYLVSIKQVRYFIDSAKKLGLREFLMLWALLIVYNTIGLSLIQLPVFSWGVFFAFIGIGGLCIYGFEENWESENAFFSLQRALLLSRRRSKQKHPLPFLTENEKNISVSTVFPLLRRIEAFEGKQRFELALHEGESPHIIFLFLESFRAKDVGCLGSNRGATPNFDALAQEGLLFSKFYSNGVLTSHALISSLYGVLPFHVSQEQKYLGFAPGCLNKLNSIRLIGIADLLKEKGYCPAYFDNTSLDYEGHTQFLKAHGFDVVIGREDIEKVIPQHAMSWGGHDEFLFDYFIEWLEEKDRTSQPTFSTLFTLSNHHPWTPPPNYQGIEFQEVSNVDYQRYLKTLHYTDQCLGRFVEMLKNHKLADKTLLFILGDHGQDFGEHSSTTILRDLHEENIHVPLLILAPGRIGIPQVFDQLASQIDLMPTLMDILGLQEVCHAMGSSLMRDHLRQEVHFYSYLQGFYLGMRKGNLKLISGGERHSVYDLDKDPQELENIYKKSTEIDSLQNHADEVFHFVHSLYEKNRFAMPEARSIDFSQCTNVTDQILDEALRVSQLPQDVNLSYCLKITPKGFKALAEHAEEILALDLSGSMITDDDLDMIVSRAKHIEVIRLSQCHLLGAKALAILFKKGRSLKEVDLSEVAELSLPPCRKTCIQTLKVSHHHNLTDESIVSLVTSLPHLKTLHINCEHVKGPGIEFLLANCPELKALHLNNAVKLSDLALKALAEKSLDRVELN